MNRVKFVNLLNIGFPCETKVSPSRVSLYIGLDTTIHYNVNVNYGDVYTQRSSVTLVL